MRKIVFFRIFVLPTLLQHNSCLRWFLGFSRLFLLYALPQDLHDLGDSFDPKHRSRQQPSLYYMSNAIYQILPHDHDMYQNLKMLLSRFLTLYFHRQTHDFRASTSKMRHCLYCSWLSQNQHIRHFLFLWLVLNRHTLWFYSCHMY